MLKRILNAKRRSRFVSEVNACKRLSHPNIISVIDHSALDSDEKSPEKMYLVMPLMAAGDLEKRAAIYQGSVDSTLLVAAALASGLAHAHGHGVIHRDVKPANILFAKDDHAPVLSDFGICLLRDDPRVTETGEVVGPRAFIAPELEDGGKLDATPAADVYSLGKVIYFMLSGGVILPRERHSEPQYDLFAGKGGRYLLLARLLDRMICARDRRVQTMPEVLTEIQRIQEWEDKQGAPLSSRASTQLSAMLVESLTIIDRSEMRKLFRSALAKTGGTKNERKYIAPLSPNSGQALRMLFEQEEKAFLDDEGWICCKTLQEALGRIQDGDLLVLCDDNASSGSQAECQVRAWLGSPRSDWAPELQSELGIEDRQLSPNDMTRFKQARIAIAVCAGTEEAQQRLASAYSALGVTKFEGTFWGMLISDSIGSSARARRLGAPHPNPMLWKSALENYVPSVRRGNQTAINGARWAFAAYMNSMHNRIHPLFSDTFLSSLDSLPAGHPLNDQRLSTEIEIILSQESGDVVRVGVIKSSGITAFDIAALDSVRRAAPFGTPPPEIVSPDGNVYLHWEFHRNREACSTYNARPFLLKAQPKAAPSEITPPAPPSYPAEAMPP